MRRLAAVAIGCGMAGLPLCLLSYLWLPFALWGREGEFVRYAVVVGEVGALAAGALGVGLGITARKHSRAGTPEHRRALRGSLVGAMVLALVLIPNLLGSLWTAR